MHFLREWGIWICSNAQKDNMGGVIAGACSHAWRIICNVYPKLLLSIDDTIFHYPFLQCNALHEKTSYEKLQYLQYHKLPTCNTSDAFLFLNWLGCQMKPRMKSEISEHHQNWAQTVALLQESKHLNLSNHEHDKVRLLMKLEIRNWCKIRFDGVWWFWWGVGYQNH